jgi:4-amino-4-deoxy-L-arabinose transferase-like glycosyltransferase
LLHHRAVSPGPSAPNPAVVAQAGVRPLPRLPLWLLCLSYGLPGLFGRDPWRNADLAAFGQMVAMAEGRTSWWAPTLGGVAGDTALLPHWLGAAFIWLLAPITGDALAARIPFALLLGATMVLVWYSTLHLARTEAAQPVPFAFGGEADPVDYARAMADGALLALIAALGLLQLGHETTPEMAQLTAVALYLYGLAAAPYRRVQSRVAVLCALPLLAESGAPAMAIAMGLGGMVVCGGSRIPEVRPMVWWVGFAALLAAALAVLLGAWRWRVDLPSASMLVAIARQWAWFLWPTWPLALWTLWRWRRQLSYRHISVPAVTVAVALAANVAMSGSDRALLLGLPGLAVLAAFALPTMKRSATAAIDWFSILFFTLAAAWIWVMYVAMQTGWPAKPAANVAKLTEGFEAPFAAMPLAFALAATAAWIWVVRWRTGRHREALWKSLVLPATGVALCWLLAMTLWLPVLDYARSPRAWTDRVAQHVPPEACIAAPGLPRAGVAALEHFGRWRIDARPDGIDDGRCEFLLRLARARSRPAAPPGWTPVAEVRRPTDRDEITLLYRRAESR